MAPWIVEPRPGARVEIRSLVTEAERRAAYELQAAIWGRDLQELVGPGIQKIVTGLGGVVAGALVRGDDGPEGIPVGDGGDGDAGDDGGETLLGVVIGLTGIEPVVDPGPGAAAAPVHWSHMLAVVPGARGLGLGKRLKAYQRRLLLARGVSRVRWTFDPLEARNAHLNLEVLGARVEGHVRDFYGSGGDSRLSAGIGTDRLVLLWSLDDPRVERRLAAVEAAPGTGSSERSSAGPADRPGRETSSPVPRVAADAAGDPAPDDPLPDAPAVDLAVPADIQALRRDDPERARRWRAATRRAFEHYLGRGHRVTGFDRGGGAAHDPPWYRLEAD